MARRAERAKSRQERAAETVRALLRHLCANGVKVRKAAGVEASFGLARIGRLKVVEETRVVETKPDIYTQLLYRKAGDGEPPITGARLQIRSDNAGDTYTLQVPSRREGYRTVVVFDPEKDQVVDIANVTSAVLGHVHEHCERDVNIRGGHEKSQTEIARICDTNPVERIELFQRAVEVIKGNRSSVRRHCVGPDQQFQTHLVPSLFLSGAETDSKSNARFVSGFELSFSGREFAFPSDGEEQTLPVSTPYQVFLMNFAHTASSENLALMRVAVGPEGVVLLQENQMFALQYKAIDDVTVDPNFAFHMASTVFAGPYERIKDTVVSRLGPFGGAPKQKSDHLVYSIPELFGKDAASFVALVEILFYNTSVFAVNAHDRYEFALMGGSFAERYRQVRQQELTRVTDPDPPEAE